MFNEISFAICTILSIRQISLGNRWGAMVKFKSPGGVLNLKVEARMGFELNPDGDLYGFKFHSHPGCGF